MRHRSMTRRLFLTTILSVVAPLLLANGACSGRKSAIMLKVDTDMKAPLDVNAVSVTISVDNTIKHNFIGRVTPQGEVLMPATLAIVEPDDPNASIRIRVMAFQERRARVLRDVRTSIPSGGRVSLLHVPIRFVNDGSVTGNLAAGVLPPPAAGTESLGPDPGDAGLASPPGAPRVAFDPFTFVSNCPNPEHTWVNGECADPYVDPASLPEFDPGVVGSSEPASGRCFDVPRCFADAAPVAFERSEGAGAVLDRATCTLRGAGDLSLVNLAFATRDTGECIRPGVCLVPLDRGDGGWTQQGADIALPPYVCRLLGGRDLQLYRGQGCAPKTAATPLCAPAVTARPAPAVDPSRPDTGVNPRPHPAPDELCWSAQPLDHARYTYRPAVATAGACTSQDLSRLVAYIDKNTNATFADLQAEIAANYPPSCGACIVGDVNAERWTPLLTRDGSITGLNPSGCVELVSGRGEPCGKAHRQWDQCIDEACLACPEEEGRRDDCRDEVQGGACKAASEGLVAGCGGDVNAYMLKFCSRFEDWVRTQCVSPPAP
jgi:hypothetical protein